MFQVRPPGWEVDHPRNFSISTQGKVIFEYTFFSRYSILKIIQLSAPNSSSDFISASRNGGSDTNAFEIRPPGLETDRSRHFFISTQGKFLFTHFFLITACKILLNFLDDHSSFHLNGNQDDAGPSHSGGPDVSCGPSRCSSNDSSTRTVDAEGELDNF